MISRLICRSFVAVIMFVCSAVAVAQGSYDSDYYAIDASYVISNWDYQAYVHRNNQLEVTERMTVFFREPRHGIYHYLNTSFFDMHKYEGKDCRFDYQLEVSDISVEGASFTTEDLDNCVNIIIGDADRLVQGERTYIIKYKMQYPDDRCPDYDELFHSVMAADVTAPTQTFTFSLEFEKLLPYDALNGGVKALGGVHGSGKELHDVSLTVTPNRISGRAENVAPYHAITIFSYLPEGYYEGAPGVPSWPYRVCYLATALFLAYMAYDLLVNKRRRKPVPVVNFYPPQGVSSAEVGTIIDASADLSDLTSLIPWLAHKGYISITEVPDSKGRTGKHASLQLTLLKADLQQLPAYAQRLMQALFGKGAAEGKTISMDDLDDVYSDMERAKSLLKHEFVGPRKLTSLSGKVVFIYLAAALMTLTLMLSSAITFFDFEQLLIAVFLVLAPTLVLSTWNLARSSKVHFMSNFRFKSVTLLIGVLAALCGFVWCGIVEPQNSLMSVGEGLVLFLLWAFCIMLSGRYNLDTTYRIDMMGQLLGLREFIKKAEQPRLMMLVDEDPEYFYSVLPYAMVFGLSDKWAKQFANIPMSQPQWYASTMPMHSMNTASLASNMNSAMSRMHDHIAAHSNPPAPSSSGGGGGGFSGGFAGGGGGGGGTGSW